MMTPSIGKKIRHKLLSTVKIFLMAKNNTAQGTPFQYVSVS
jgi:hypothetical protein